MTGFYLRVMDSAQAVTQAMKNPDGRPYPKGVHKVTIAAAEVRRGDLVSDDGRLRTVILDPIADEIMGVRILRIHFGDGGDMPALPGGTVTVFRLER
jgi:hypothetical protein